MTKERFPRAARMARTLNLLPLVRWDRYIANHVEGFDVYGWIDRADGRADFVLIRFDPDGNWDEFWTSSAEHSRPMFEALTGQPSGEDHNDCRRVDETFGDLVENKTSQRAA